MTFLLAATTLAACGGSTPAKSPSPSETLYHPVAPPPPLPRVRHLRPPT